MSRYYRSDADEGMAKDVTLKLLDADFLLTSRALIYRIVQMLSKLAGFRKRPTPQR